MRAFILLIVFGAFGATACGLDKAGLGALPGEPGPIEEAGGEPGQGGPAPPPATVSEAGAPRADGAPSGSPGADASGITPLLLLPDATLAADGDVVRDDAAVDHAVAGDDAAPVVVADAQAGGEASTGGCVSAIPVGWTLVIYDFGFDACPSSFAEHDVMGPPVLAAGACSCTCTVTADGDCSQGMLTFSGGRNVNNDCPEVLFSGTVNGSDCTPLDVTFQLPAMASFEANPLSAGGGTCATALVADPTALSAPSARYCDVPAASADSVCNGLVPSGFGACIATPGSASCPASTLFQNRVSVEDHASLECSDCNGCRVSTACSDATITAFPDLDCLAPPVLTAPADGNCDPMPQRPAPSVLSFEYNVVATTTCTTAARSTASAHLINPLTICCQ